MFRDDEGATGELHQSYCSLSCIAKNRETAVDLWVSKKYLLGDQDHVFLGPSCLRRVAIRIRKPVRAMADVDCDLVSVLPGAKSVHS